jgi:hypothetical protein
MEAVEHDSRPDASDLATSIELSATPGEYEPVTFSIWPRRNIEELRIHVDSLSGPGGASIPDYAVRVWAVQHKP